MEKRIVFKRADGGCGVIIPAAKALKTEQNPSGLTLEEIAVKDVPAGLTWRIVDADKLPTDRDFRNAWTDNNATDTVDVCMDKAREIHMDNIRKEREKVFVKMGFPTKLNPALETAIISKEIRDKLQELRDIPQRINLHTAKTPEELKAIWPEELK